MCLFSVSRWMCDATMAVVTGRTVPIDVMKIQVRIFFYSLAAMKNVIYIFLTL